MQKRLHSSRRCNLERFDEISWQMRVHCSTLDGYHITVSLFFWQEINRDRLASMKSDEKNIALTFPKLPLPSTLLKLKSFCSYLRNRIRFLVLLTPSTVLVLVFLTLLMLELMSLAIIVSLLAGLDSDCCLESCGSVLDITDEDFDELVELLEILVAF